jgi:two-component system cell cycle response regulator
MSENANIRIVVVEDDQVFSRVLEKRLTSEGYQVMLAPDGREGMKAIVSFDPDLVISDWMMPHVDGLELCQSVKTGLGDSAPYFILLTAKGEISDRVLALDTGADDYLIKPCEPGELRARVRAGLRNVQYARQLRKIRAETNALRADLEAARDELRRVAELLPLCAACGRLGVAEGADSVIVRILREHDLLRPLAGACSHCGTGTTEHTDQAPRAA